MSTKKLTQDIFLSRCKERHGNKFDYSKSVYINAQTKIEIACNTCFHTWTVTPGNHVGPKRSGCPQCKATNSKARNKSLFNTEWFIEKSNKRHKNRYDYSKTEYINNESKISILCKEHGIFEQWPSDHINGRGCLECSGVRKKTTEEFIEEARKIFPQFDYSLVEYSTAHIPVKLVCPIHGEFKQKPNAILNHIGCTKCGILRMLSTKVANGDIRAPEDMSAAEAYRKHVWRISNQQYKIHKDKINPENLQRSLKYHLDHKYSIQQGWQNNVPAEIIGGWKNLQILEGKKNRQKGNKCEITLDQIQEKDLCT
jgi:hypothetical protein